jgi:hypothetical protein
VTVATGGILDIAGDVANAIADNALLSIAGGNLSVSGFVNLGAGINEVVAGLTLGTTVEPAGTYGSSLSSATFKNDEFFSGTGIVTVGVSADYNGDQRVNAADYVTWRKDPTNPAFGGDPAGYNTWRQHFGEGIPGSGPSLGPEAVPEPSTSVLVGLAVMGLFSTRRRSLYRWNRS